MKFIGLWILNPLKTSGGQPVALGGFGVWLGGYFVAWVLIAQKSFNLSKS